MLKIVDYCIYEYFELQKRLKLENQMEMSSLNENNAYCSNICEEYVQNFLYTYAVWELNQVPPSTLNKMY